MSEKISRRRAIAVSAAGAATIAAASSGFDPKAVAAAEAFAPLRLPITPTITIVSDVPVTGGHKTTIKMNLAGSNGNHHLHTMIVTRAGGVITISDSIKAFNAQTGVLSTEIASHTYSSGNGANGTTQVSGQQVINGEAAQPLTLNYKNVTNPYAGITDPQALITAILKNKRLA